ncbi:UNVERIFIED_ORG: hypothetical protein B2H93_14765 [Clostridium botulinum]
MRENIQVTRTIKEYKDNMIKYNGAVTDKQLIFAKQLTDMVYDENKTDKVEVIIARCGMGKSVVINSIIKNLINKIYIGSNKGLSDKDKYNGDGVIVITDSLDRLDCIKNTLQDCCYLMKYDNNVNDFENRKTFDIQLKEQYKYPVLLMTTQKYFRLEENEREFMYKWALGSRKIAFIDEKPILTREDDISEKFLCDIKIELDNCEESENKQYLLDTFEKIYSDIGYIRKTYSAKYETIWLKSSKKSLLISEDEDIKFFDILSKNVSSEVYDKVVTLKRIYTDGCLFVNKKNKGQANNRHFYVLNNNTNKFDTTKCKYYILDATAKFDIDYKINKDLINFVEIDDKKDSKDITIKYIPWNTSKNNMSNDNIDMISGWINNNFNIKDTLIATYSKKSGIYQKFQKLIQTDNNLVYFGNIKGRNDWSNLTKMIHMGFNRQSDISYLLTYIYLREDKLDWNNKDEKEIELNINELLGMEKGMFKDLLMKVIMMSKILVDTEQNVMRIKCRNFSNTDNCDIYIIVADYFEKNGYMTRLVDKLNANYMTFLPNDFEEYKIMNRSPNEGKKITNAQKIWKYLKGLEIGTLITTKDIYEKANVNKSQFDKAKKDNKLLKDWLNKHKKNRGKYIA